MPGCSLFVDDLMRCYPSKYMHTMERQFRQCVNKIGKWATSYDFKISKKETKCVHFCQKRKRHNDPVLTLEYTEIQVVDEYTFLGLIYEKSIFYSPHEKPKNKM